jgi:hypothetical protein
MTVRSTKASGPRSQSKTAAKVVKLASVPPKTVANEAVKLVDKGSTRAATASKAVKKGTAMTVRSTKASRPHSRMETAAKAVELASIPPKPVTNEAMKFVNQGSTEAAAASEVVKKETAMTVQSTKASGPHSRTETAAQAVELASIPPKTAANEAMKLVDDASTEVAVASESVKGETASAIDAYKDSAAETLDSTEEIVKATSEVITDVTEIHQVMWNSMQRVLHNIIDIPAQFTSCTSVAELAEKQREVMRRGLTNG